MSASLLLILQVSMDTLGPKASWFLRNIEVVDVARNMYYIFPAERWIDPKAEPRSAQQILLPQDANGHTAELVEYSILVHTSDVPHAGTSANISLQLFGNQVGHCTAQWRLALRFVKTASMYARGS